ncbi:MAG: hypothetical protein HHJ11_09705 [Phycicoccus sp.]|nr:hypothetical protein [Phycicoccus sp.]NMM33680.1 hypothetical protein [Phycicoccus sp.]
MTFDPAKVPGQDSAVWGQHCKDRALEALVKEDWRGVYDWTKSWVGWGGGAWLPDTWLLYAASALLHGQPRSAVHSLDLGLGTWLEGRADRAVLSWCRGCVVWTRLNDPKTALLAFELAVAAPPPWLAAEIDGKIQRCSEAALASRKRVASVKPSPDFTGFKHVGHTVAPPSIVRADGDEPVVWTAVSGYFTA